MSPKVAQYRDYKKFDYAVFNNNLPKQPENLNFSELDCHNMENIHVNLQLLKRIISGKTTQNLPLKYLVKLSW